MENSDQDSKPEDMNYNDRHDGYGFGEAESRDTEKDYEKDPHFTYHCIDMGKGYRRHKDEPYTEDENGLRNQYGPVDQYVFRSHHLVGRYEIVEDREKEADKEDKASVNNNDSENEEEDQI